MDRYVGIKDIKEAFYKLVDDGVWLGRDTTESITAKKSRINRSMQR